MNTVLLEQCTETVPSAPVANTPNCLFVSTSLATWATADSEQFARDFQIDDRCTGSSIPSITPGCGHVWQLPSEPRQPGIFLGTHSKSCASGSMPCTNGRSIILARRNWLQQRGHFARANIGPRWLRMRHHPYSYRACLNPPPIPSHPRR
jgi:hypothetical protein